ncbi:MAG: tripartite tricarboxylate transporter substrate-binding protein [Proteobacteria bacterium]|nr:tripartite tricarboxylate transporter substrate-binding protein [Pseudomonadota bacterium]
MAKHISTGRLAAALCCAFMAFVQTQASADEIADFYKGKQIMLIVNSGSGGLNALYGRTLGDRMGKHVPGQPKVIYQFMTGSGGLKGLNYCYNVAPKDGATLCQLLNSLGLAQLLRPKGVKYDAGKFNYIGNTGDQNGSIAVWHTVPAKTLMDLRNIEVPFAATGRGSESFYDPTLLNAMFGTKMKVVMGYKGGGDLDLTMEREETTGRAGPVISYLVRKPHWITEGKVRILLQVGLKKMPGYEHIPLMLDLARNEEERQIIQLMSSRSAIGRPVVTPPGVPADRVAALRKAFVATMNDPAFKEDMKKRKMLNDWRTGEDVAKIMATTLATPKLLLQKTRKTLGWN